MEPAGSLWAWIQVPELKSQEESDEVKKRVASDFLVRRVTAINIAGAEHTVICTAGNGDVAA